MPDIVVSVVIPSYNHGKFLKEAIHSVETLNLEGIEIIIVDDGSTDEYSQQVSLDLKERGYQIYICTNKGVAASRNFGIAKARGKYILPLDADNKLLSPYLIEGVRRLENNPETGVVFGDALIFGEKGGTWVNHPLQPEEIIFENYIDNCAIFRKDAWQSVGGYDENAPFHTREDWFFWLALLGKGWKFEYLNAFCFEYRYLENSKVRTRYSILRNRLIINEYIFPTQTHLLEKFRTSGALTATSVRQILERLESQLAHYHFIAGNVWQGYRYLFRSLANGLPVLKFLSLGLGWPLRRLKSTNRT